MFLPVWTVGTAKIVAFICYNDQLPMQPQDFRYYENNSNGYL